MFRRLAFLIVVALTLNNCSFGYDVFAVNKGGTVVFVVNHSASPHPSCLHFAKVYEENREREPLWLESTEYNADCRNNFPISYGGPLRGRRSESQHDIPAQPLRRGIIYNVSIDAGGGGYGGGRFIILADGRVENLTAPVTSGPDNQIKP